MISKQNKILIIVIIVLILIGIGAYFLLLTKEKPKETALPVPVKKEAIAPKEEKIVLPSYQYDVSNLRDPFSPLIIKRQESKKGGSPLEGYDLEELKVTGIIRDKRGLIRALIQAPDGRFYIVRENDKIGLGGGKIKKIHKDSVEVGDFEKSYEAAISQKVKFLKLRMEEGQ